MKSAVFVGRRLALAKYAHIRSGESEEGFSTASSFFSAISLLTACRGALMIPQFLSAIWMRTALLFECVGQYKPMR